MVEGTQIRDPKIDKAISRARLLRNNPEPEPDTDMEVVELLERIKSEIPVRIQEAAERGELSAVIWEIGYYETNGFGDPWGDYSDVYGISKRNWETLGQLFEYCLKNGLNPQTVFEHTENKNSHKDPIAGEVVYTEQRTKLKMIINW